MTEREREYNELLEIPPHLRTPAESRRVREVQQLKNELTYKSEQLKKWFGEQQAKAEVKQTPPITPKHPEWVTRSERDSHSQSLRPFAARGMASSTVTEYTYPRDYGSSPPDETGWIGDPSLAGKTVKQYGTVLSRQTEEYLLTPSDVETLRLVFPKGWNLPMLRGLLLAEFGINLSDIVDMTWPDIFAILKHNKKSVDRENAEQSGKRPSQSLCGAEESTPRAISMSDPPPDKGFRFSIALSFPGEHRDYVSRVDAVLAAAIGTDKVFYDDRFPGEFAFLNLDTHLQKIYRKQSAMIVVFICRDYDRKQWCRLEWRAIRDIIKNRRDADVILVRMDDGEVEGILSIDGYLDGQKHSPEKVAELILERLR